MADIRRRRKRRNDDNNVIVIVLSLVLMLGVTMADGQLMTCPQVCSCIWRNGKQTTICENQNLISIPNQISPSTQVLDLNNNNFQILPSKAFQERGLINLQKLFLPHCKLGAIADDAFHQLTNLVELDLSDNLLTQVPVRALANATNLRRLLLNNNHIATIGAESFAALGSLKFLNLSGCKTHTIEARAFYGLRDLEYLYLHNNQLTTLPYAVVADLPALYSFELYRNPWQCNCEMRPTREWMIRNNVGQSIPPTCELPVRLSGLMWNSLDLDDFACEPDIITTTVEVVKAAGTNATLSCVVKGIPEPRVFWYMDHGYYNLSSNHNAMRAHKYHVSEDRSEGTVNSVLTIVNLDPADDGTSYICSAENRAGIKSKNFTVFVLPSGTFGVPANWSKVELAGGIVGLLITLVLAFVVITLILIRSKKLPLYGSGRVKSAAAAAAGRDHHCHSAGSAGDSLEKKKPAFGMQQHLSMLGLDGIDKKPEIFANNTRPAPDLVTTKAALGYELNHFANNGMSTVGMPSFVHDGNNHDTIFMDGGGGEPCYQMGEPAPGNGLFRAVMVPPSVITTSTTVISAPNTNSSTVTTTTGGRISPQFVNISASSLYNQYLSQYDPNLQQHHHQQQQPQLLLQPDMMMTRFERPSPAPFMYGNSAFINDSGAMISVGMMAAAYEHNHHHHEDPDDVFRSTVAPSPATSHDVLMPLPRQSTTVNQAEESIYGMRRPMQPPPPAPPPAHYLQPAPPTPIYGITVKTGPTPLQRWTCSNGGTLTPGPYQPQMPTPSAMAHSRNNLITMATSLSNIRCSPDEGYGEESNSTGHSVGQLEGTEV